MKVLLYGIKISYEIRELIKKTILILQKKKIIFGIEKSFFKNLKLNNFFCRNLNIYSFYQKKLYSANLLLTFGGDGTILNALPLLKNHPIPVVGINTGRLGFLTSISKNDFLNHLDDYLNNNFLISKRNLIKIKNISFIKYPYALNEICINRTESNSMITIKSSINGEYLNTFWGDGLIISTPTGSTGYNLSCGGPIIFPENQILILTPIAGHNLNIRPLVVPNSVILKFNVQSRSKKFSISLDSRLYLINNNTDFEIKIASFYVQLVFLKKYSYYKNLREKLNWGIDSRN